MAVLLWGHLFACFSFLSAGLPLPTKPKTSSPHIQIFLVHQGPAQVPPPPRSPPGSLHPPESLLRPPSAPSRAAPGAPSTSSLSSHVLGIWPTYQFNKRSEALHVVLGKATGETPRGTALIPPPNPTLTASGGHPGEEAGGMPMSGTPCVCSWHPAGPHAYKSTKRVSD